MVRPYTQYLVQKVLDYCRGLSTGSRERVDAWLSPLGGDVLGCVRLRHRLGKKGFELVAL